MKTEREFINSVYAKYEIEKIRRERAAKRSRMIYIGATLAASFCFVILGIARILPAFMGANSAAEADAITYSVTNGSMYEENGLAENEMIFYAAQEDSKKSKNYTVDEEAVFDVVSDECEEVAEAPMATESSEAKTKEYSFAERAVLSVADCSFEDKGNGYIDIIADGMLVGTIQTDRYAGLVVNSGLQDDSSELKAEDNNPFTKIVLEADENYTVFLSIRYFSAEDIEKIAQYVEK